MKVVRVYASPAVDNPEAPRFCFDVHIDGDGNLGTKAPTFGMQGQFNPNGMGECYPFVLYPNGRIDFGSGFDSKPGERNSSFDHWGGVIELNRILTLRSSVFGAQLYRIVRIDDLTSP